MDMKEKIMYTALRLFAMNGYEATSVSDIAGELGVTKGALYKHYKNKRAIFDSIVERVFQEDLIHAKRYGVPEETYDKAPHAFKSTSIEQLKNFIEARFRFWIEDELSRNFRKMLTLEQYRSSDAAGMYKMCVGQDGYIEDLFRVMMEQGAMKKNDPKLLALEFFAPYHYLLNMAMLESPSFKEEAARLLSAHMQRFVEANVIQEKEGVR